VELVARDGDPHAFPLRHVMSQTANCNFSFSGIKSWLRKTANQEEEKFGKKLSAVVWISVPVTKL